ncbi:MAG: rhodanese-like domain-containing protein [Myxococcota bacterium]
MLRGRDAPAAARPTSAVEDPRAEAPAPAEPPEDDLEVEVPIPGSVLLDIREPGELAHGVAEGAVLLPMDLVPHHLDELPRDRPLTIYCAAGARSWGVAHWLREQGFPKAYSLAGGIGVFAATGHPVAPPPGLMPGTRVTLPADATAGGVPVGPGVSGEIIREVDDHVEVLVRDAQGFPVRVEAQTWAIGRR